MNQPDLGLKVSELRQQKALTQEQLAERCEVSARTIQRIESGEVDPRAYTLHYTLHPHHSASAVVVEEKSILQDRPARTTGAQLPDHHDPVPLRRRFPAHGLSRRARIGGRTGRERHGKYTRLHPGDHLPAIAPDPHRHLLHVSGRGQCHAGAVGQTHPICIEHPVCEMIQQGDSHRCR